MGIALSGLKACLMNCLLPFAAILFTNVSAGQGDSASIIQIVCPICGIVTANLMYMAPLLELLEVRKTKALHELNPIQFVFQLFTCLGWLFYSFNYKNIYLFFSSWLGSLLGLFGVLTVLPFCEEEARMRMERYSLALAVLLTVSGLICVNFLTDAAGLGVLRNYYVGVLSNLLFVIYLGIPLSGLMHVIKERNAASISWKLVTFKLVSISLWWTYGFLTGAPFIWAPNSLGAILCLVQLSVILVFRGTKPPDQAVNPEGQASLHAYTAHIDSEHHDEVQNPVKDGGDEDAATARTLHWTPHERHPPQRQKSMWSAAGTASAGPRLTNPPINPENGWGPGHDFGVIDVERYRRRVHPPYEPHGVWAIPAFFGSTHGGRGGNEGRVSAASHHTYH